MPVPSNEHKNQHYASFATTSRLVACLTSESLVPVFFVPSTEEDLEGLCLLLRPKTVQEEEEIPTKVTANDILAVVPLRGLPIINNASVATLNGVQCPRIDMVDGLDMHSHIYSIDTSNNDSKGSVITDATKKTLLTILSSTSQFSLRDSYSAEDLWDRFATDLEVNGKLKEQIKQELASSIIFQSKLFFFNFPFVVVIDVGPYTHYSF